MGHCIQRGYSNNVTLPTTLAEFLAWPFALLVISGACAGTPRITGDVTRPDYDSFRSELNNVRDELQLVTQDYRAQGADLYLNGKREGNRDLRAYVYFLV